VLKNLPY